MVVVIGGTIGLVQVGRWQAVAIAMGLAGATLVIGVDTATTSWKGVALAAAGGLAWALYVLYRMRQPSNAENPLIKGFWLSAVLSLVVHLATESTIMPPPLTLICTILVGILPLALGNLAWDYGVRHGNKVQLATYAYATPLVSTLILVVAGLAQPTLGLLLGGALIVAAGVFSSERSGDRE